MSASAFGILVAGAVVLFVVGLALWALVLLQLRGQTQLERRVQGIGVDLRDEFEQSGQAALLARMARRGRDIERLVDPEGESGRLLIQAGWRSTAARAIWYAFQAACPVVALLFAMLLWVFKGEQVRPAVIVLASIASIIVSLLLPRFILRHAAASRRARIKAEVPLFIHLLVLLFEAGLSTRQAIASLVREGRGVLPELGREFDLVLRQLEAGGDTAEVLRTMGEGLDVADLTGVLGVLRQIDRYGGEVREPLLDALAVLEERRGLDMREQVNTLSGRMTIVMVLFFFPALLIFVAGPAVISIFRALGEAAGR